MMALHSQASPPYFEAKHWLTNWTKVLVTGEATPTCLREEVPGDEAANDWLTAFHNFVIHQDQDPAGSPTLEPKK